MKLISKEQFTQNKSENRVTIPFPSVLMVDWLKCRRPQNISGASQQNSGAAFSWTTEVVVVAWAGMKLWNGSSRVIQVSGSPEVPKWKDVRLFQAENFTLSQKHSHTPSWKLDAQAGQHVEGVNYALQIGILGLCNFTWLSISMGEGVNWIFWRDLFL